MEKCICAGCGNEHEIVEEGRTIDVALDEKIIARAVEVISELMNIIERIDAQFYTGSSEITRADDLLKLIDGQIDVAEYEELTRQPLTK